MTTVISHIGHGPRANDLERLFEMLETHPLDRTFERYGNFAYPAEAIGGGWVYGVENGTAFSGNFFTYSCAFHLVSDEPALLERLTAAIRANQLRADYLDQPPPFDPAKLVINRKRFSETQGEVELIYDGRRIEQYGDKIELQPSGCWRGHLDGFWHDVARRDLAALHAKAREQEKRRAA